MKKKEVLTFYKFEQTVSIIEYKNKTKKGVMKYDNKKNQLEIWCDLDKLKKQIKWIHDCYIEKLEDNNGYYNDYSIESKKFMNKKGDTSETNYNRSNRIWCIKPRIRKQNRFIQFSCKR